MNITLTRSRDPLTRPPKSAHRSRGFHTLVLATALGLAGFAGLAWFNFHSFGRHLDPPPPPPHVDNITALVTLRRAGVSPEFLAAIGVTGQGATTIRGRVDATVADQGANLQAADAALVSARQTLAALQTQLHTTANVDPAALAAAQAAVTSAIASRQSALQAVQSELLAQDLTADQLATLAALARNNAHHKLPIQYLVVDRSDAQWIDLRDALAAIAIAARDGTTPNDHATQTAAAADADPAVAAAAANLASLLAAVDAATGENPPNGP